MLKTIIGNGHHSSLPHQQQPMCTSIPYITTIWKRRCLDFSRQLSILATHLCSALVWEYSVELLVTWAPRCLLEEFTLTSNVTEDNMAVLERETYFIKLHNDAILSWWYKVHILLVEFQFIIVFLIIVVYICFQGNYFNAVFGVVIRIECSECFYSY